LGGYGSGWQGSSAPTVESLRKRKLDLADLERRGLVNEGDQISLASALVELRWNGLKLYYWANQSDYTNELVPFDGWLSCPRCGRRCRILYRAQRFRCRECCGLVYQSTRETWPDRADTQANKLALKICGGDRELYDGDEFPPKPRPGALTRSVVRVLSKSTLATAPMTQRGASW
jgi:hypothetical protein